MQTGPEGKAVVRTQVECGYERYVGRNIATTKPHLRHVLAELWSHCRHVVGYDEALDQDTLASDLHSTPESVPFI